VPFKHVRSNVITKTYEKYMLLKHLNFKYNLYEIF
jgi:hypothetical protein